MSRVILIGAMALLLATAVVEAHSPPKHAKVFFINLQEGDVVKSPFKVKFGIEGFGIAPAGTKGKRRHTAGHHHLLVDVEQLPDLDAPIPSDEHHIHFDQGETEAVLELSPGRHTLQLLLGDEEHEPQDPPLFSERITITVE
ncbi:MAG: rod shape-determining protein RodA [gamma proteobacterium symbiont of Ctena orbiculata]|nr:MAG: rod shape-determining protein RodA [gamma proteobacterium symbiont of Ctena orbiculata]PVV20502.1 MAG: rod shape-determining protein RodA [gamma proteobacterium symbiont of Ctena orbiculata]PVV25382.1 MAG: rod shape-determining protein RodA [gamma proteobacterium symbiont of Ctena orbiculata]